MPFDAATSNLSAAPRSQCLLCPAGPLCVTQDLPAAELGQWSAVVLPHVSLPSVGKRLVEAGAAADTLYVVRAGCLKSYTVDADGNERVRSFFLRGDLVGLEMLDMARAPATIVSVVASQVCRLPKAQVLNTLARAPALARRMLERTSRDLTIALALSGDYTADQRVAAFLLWMEQRLESRNGVLHLPMTRRDIASYLRLATETVCRVLTRFESRGWLAHADKGLRIVNRPELAELAAPVGIAAPAAAELRRAA